MQAADIPAHVFVYKAGRVWAAICMRCSSFLAASPQQANLRAPVTLHVCAKQAKKSA